MKLYRNLRVQNLIAEELGKLLIREFEFSGAIVTVTDVVVSSDLLRADVYLGIIPHEKGPEVFYTLSRARPWIQHKLLRKINIKPMPTIVFQIMNHET